MIYKLAGKIKQSNTLVLLINCVVLLAFLINCQVPLQVKGQYALRSGKFIEAVSIYKNIVNKDPKNADALVDYSIALYNICAYEEAVLELKKAIELKWRTREAELYLGLCQEKLGNEEDAINTFKRNLNINSSDALSYSIQTHLNRLLKIKAAKDAHIKQIEEKIIQQSGLTEQAENEAQETEELEEKLDDDSKLDGDSEKDKTEVAENEPDNEQADFEPEPVKPEPPKVLLKKEKVNKQIIMAITDFGAETKYEAFGRGITRMLTTDLSRLKEIRIVERSNLKMVVEELELSMTGLTDENTIPKAGKLIGAGKLLGGVLHLAGENQLRFDITLTNVEPYTINWQGSAQGKTSNLFEIEKKMVQDILAGLDIVPSEEEKMYMGHFGTDSPETLIYYMEAVDAFDKYDYVEAAAQLEESLKTDKNFACSMDLLAEIYSQQGRFDESSEYRNKARKGQLELCIHDMSVIAMDISIDTSTTALTASLVKSKKSAKAVVARQSSQQQAVTSSLTSLESLDISINSNLLKPVGYTWLSTLDSGIHSSMDSHLSDYESNFTGSYYDSMDSDYDGYSDYVPDSDYDSY